MYTAIQETYPNDIGLWPGAVPIYHVHGQLGQYDPGSSGHRGYQPEFEWLELKQARDGISIVSDAEEPAILGMVRNRLEAAGTICFLGFDYHTSNMRKDKGPWELYNLARDGTELNDLAAKMPEKVAELKKRHTEWDRRTNLSRTKPAANKKR